MNNLVFSIGSLNVLVWHLVCLALLIVAIALIVVTCVYCKKQRCKKAQEVVEEQPDESALPEEQTDVATDDLPQVATEEQPEEQPAEPANEPVAEEQPEPVAEAQSEATAEVAEQPAPVSQSKPRAKKAAPKKQAEQPASVEEPAEEQVATEADDVEVEVVEDDGEEEETPAAKTTAKVYHVSLRRDDGLWQVKLGKGSRALKLFKTQAEAIAFAKEKAKNQEGRVVIHKVDGKIRKLRY